LLDVFPRAFSVHPASGGNPEMSDQQQGQAQPQTKQGTGETPKEPASPAPAPAKEYLTAGAQAASINTAAVRSSQPPPENEPATFADDNVDGVVEFNE
jgi:hypothetical protein